MNVDLTVLMEGGWRLSGEMEEPICPCGGS